MKRVLRQRNVILSPPQRFQFFSLNCNSAKKKIRFTVKLSQWIRLKVPDLCRYFCKPHLKGITILCDYLDNFKLSQHRRKRWGVKGNDSHRIKKNVNIDGENDPLGRYFKFRVYFSFLERLRDRREGYFVSNERYKQNIYHIKIYCSNQTDLSLI